MYHQKDLELIEHPGTQHYEWKIQAKDGNIKNVIFDKATLYGANRKPIGVIGIISDITDLKQAEAEIRKIHRLYQDTIENANGIPYQLNYQTGKYDYFGQKSMELLGIPSEEMTVAKMKLLVSDYLKTGTSEFKAAVKNSADFQNGKTGHYSTELRIITPNGVKHWLHDTAVPIKDEQTGKIIGSQGILIDITDRKLAELEIQNNSKAMLNVLEDLNREIDERKEIENALRESQERFNLAMQAAKDGIWDWNLMTNEVYFSPGWKTMLGYTNDEIKNELSEWERLTDSEDLKKTWNVIKECTTGKRDRFLIEFKMKHKDGHWIDVLSRANTVFDENGTAVRMIGTHVDISERKQMENSLRESEEQYRSLFEEMLSAFALHEMIFDKKGNPVDYRFIAVNPAFEKLTGLKQNQLIGRTVLEVLPETEKYWIETYGEVVRTRNPKQFENYSQELDRYYEGIAYSPEQGKFATIFRDVTERILAQNALKNKATETQWMLQSMINAFVIFDSVFDDKGTFVSYRFVYINDAYEKITGVKNDEVKGKTVHEVWPETEESWIEYYGSIAISGKSRSFEMYHDPTKKWYHCNAYRPWDSPDRFCVIFEDITQRLEFIRQLENSEKRLRLLASHLQNIREDERKAIAREIHDEIAQILTALKIDISIFGSELQSSFPEILQKHSADIASMKNLIDESIRKIRDLISRLRPEVFESMDLVDALRTQMTEMTRKSGLTGHFRSSVKEIALGNEQNLAFFRIFQEALTNIIRHARAQTVHASFSEKNNLIILKVRDDGVGIDPAKMEKSDSYGLTGMRERALFLGGNLTITGKPGQGTEIILEIPKK